MQFNQGRQCAALFPNMEYNICIEAYIRWEQLTGRSFQEMNFDDAGDLHRLLYCAYIIDHKNHSTFDVFERSLQSNTRLYKQALAELSRHNAAVAQFSTIKLNDSIGSESSEDGPTFIGDVAARLVVMAGIDARYVMREMTVEDMLRYVRALGEKQRQEAEAQRLWCYLSILPHIDGRKLNSPQKLITFPWEVEANRAESLRVAEQGKAEFEKFIRGEIYPAPKEISNG